ncbi:MAG: hypothetical protein J6Y20_14490 [Lachnospiraceae bacterium]|nr:hypothetical protein [Lachnospiraceae bacterium]
MRDITITSLETITAFGVTSGEYLFTLDELQNASVAQSQETTEITGKAGRKLSTLKRNKAVTISGANGLVSGGLLEMQVGTNFELQKATKVMWTDYITVKAGETAGTLADIKTAYTAVGTAGAEIVGLYIRNTDGTLGTKYTQKASATQAGEFSYAPATKTLSFYEDQGAIADTAIKAGTELVAFYQRNITADVLTNRSDTYSQKCSLYIDAIGEDKCANVYRVQFYIPKADFNGEFTFEMGDNQTVHNFDAEALSGACGTSGEFFTYTVFGADTADTPVT